MNRSTLGIRPDAVTFLAGAGTTNKTKTPRPFLTAALCGAFVLTVASARADTISYVDAAGNTYTATATAITASIIRLTDGWWYVPSDTTVTTTNLTVTGHARLILCDGAIVNANGGYYGGAGIDVNASGSTTNALTIYAQTLGTGILNANGSYKSAGIGGGQYSGGGGTVTIHGGVVNANGGGQSAGIGGGGHKGNGGTVTIHDGIVNANGGNYGAGIGGGGSNGSGYGGNGGTVTIHGGTVNATGSRYSGAGIGGGRNATGSGALTITSGNVTLTDGTPYGNPSTAAIIATPRNDNPSGDDLFRIPVTGKTPGEILTVTVFFSAIGTYTYRATVDPDGNATLWLPAAYATDTLSPRVAVTYLDANGATQATAAILINPGTAYLADDWYTVTGNVATATLTVTGNARLILCDGTTLNANGTNNAGINVRVNSATTNALTIYAQTLSTGTLTAYGNYESAGIGGGYIESGGAITIHGGIINANGGNGGNGGAGIGGGYNGNGGTVTIHGGKVNANGGEFSAGIGGSYLGSGNVTIHGGTVNAKGGYHGAGIGGGYHGSGGMVTIHGGIINANGGGRVVDGVYFDGNGSGGAGIGGGYHGSGDMVTIHGGEVNANGGNVINGSGYGGAGIGGGYHGSGGTVTIHSGKVNANGGNGGFSGNGGAGIGGGYDGNGGTVTIHGGVVTATSGNYGNYGVGIGGGYGASSPGTLTITSGNVTLTNGYASSTSIIATARNANPDGDTLTGHMIPRTAPGLSIRIDITSSAIGDYTYRAITDADGNTTVWLPAGYTADDAVFIHTVTFDGIDDIAFDAQSIDHGGRATIPANAPPRTGHTLGWFLGDTAYDFATPVTNSFTLTPVWTVTAYTITYENTKGAVNPNTVTNYTIESATITFAPLPDVDGYIFAGWNPASIPAGSTGDKTVTAQWTAIPYAITYENTKGAANPNPDTYTIEDDITFEPLPVVEGYTFAGWDIASIAVGSMGAKTIAAQWTPVPYAITYADTKGADNPNPDTYTIENGITFAALPNVTGYTFTGWSIASIAAGTTGAKTVTAQWTPVVYAITYANTKGADNPNPDTYTIEDAITFEPLPDVAGYTFASWNPASIQIGTTGEKIVTAQWAGESCDATFDGNGGDPAATGIAQTFGSAYVLPTPDPSRAGYSFTGWTLDGAELPGLVAVTTNHTVVAAWTANVYTVAFDGNGGEPAATNIAQTFGDAYILPAPDPSRTGYGFTGWTLDGAGLPSLVASATNHTVTAAWTANVYTVTFDAQGGEGADASKDVTFGDTYGALPEPTLTDYTFAGWFTEPGGNGTRIEGGTTVTLASAHTAYAHWMNIPPPYLSENDDPQSAPVITTAYAGFAYDDNGAVRGTVTLSAKMTLKKGVESWTFTAKAVLQNATVSFSGKTWDGAAGKLALTARTGEAFRADIGDGAFHGTLSGGKVGASPLRIAGARDAFAGRKNTVAQTWLEREAKGYYTAALIDGADGATAGYLTLTVGNLGSVKIAGKLSDGTAVSGSTKLLEGLNDAGWLCVALHKPLYTKKGSIGGLLWISPSDKVLRVDTDYGWFIDWVSEKPGAAFTRALDVCGGWYGTAAALKPSYLFSADVPALPPLVAGLSGGMWMSVAFPQDVPVTATGGKLTMQKGVAAKKPAKDAATPNYIYDAVNPSCATLTYTAKTGIFKGGFKLYYAGDGARGFQHKAASISYAGILTPKRDAFYKDRPLGLGTGTVKIGAEKVEIPVKLE